MNAAQTKRLRLGFVPLIDCAPIVAAHELGIFKNYGLNVELSREPGWATVRDKIVYGILDASHALGGLIPSVTLGLGSIPVACSTGLIMSRNGNAITLASRLVREGIHHVSDLAAWLNAKSRAPLTFGVVAKFSSHEFLLKKWLRQGGVNVDRDIRMVVLPPPQMSDNLKSGNIDGFCVGEPWNTVACESGYGVCMAGSMDLAPAHPEKVLMVRQDWAQNNQDIHLLLIRSLLDACAWCQQVANQKTLSQWLSLPQYLKLPIRLLQESLSGIHLKQAKSGSHLFHGDKQNIPDLESARWIFDLIEGTSHFMNLNRYELIQQAFRVDWFEAAEELKARKVKRKEKNEIRELQEC